MVPGAPSKMCCRWLSCGACACLLRYLGLWLSTCPPMSMRLRHLLSQPAGVPLPVRALFRKLALHLPHYVATWHPQACPDHALYPQGRLPCHAAAGCPEDCLFSLNDCPYSVPGQPCSNAGWCMSATGICQCYLGYTGDDCSQCDQGYLRYFSNKCYLRQTACFCWHYVYVTCLSLSQEQNSGPQLATASTLLDRGLHIVHFTVGQAPNDIAAKARTCCHSWTTCSCCRWGTALAAVLASWQCILAIARQPSVVVQRTFSLFDWKLAADAFLHLAADIPA